jgi:hypothetical protein
VMIYNDGGSGSAINISGNSNVTLTPETTGPYAGITLFQVPTSPAPASPFQISITGNGAINISGTIYGADTNLKIAGNGSQIGSQLIVSTLTLGGNGAVSVGSGSIASLRVALVQ